MRALVTGSAGFVGRHMVRALTRRGYDVIGCDVAHTRGALDSVDMFRGEITLKDGRPFDLVVHAAARAPHRAAIDRRPAVMAYNLMLDAAMFDWAVRTGQRRVLYLSSSAAYPIDLQNDYATARPLREGDIRGGALNVGRPDAGYGWTKLTGEQVAAAAVLAGVAVHVVRPFSGYGEDQSLDFPFGAFLDRARRREDPFVIWGTGEQVRDWIHIDDVVEGALAVVEQDVRDPVNLCTGRGTSMLELAEMICAVSGYSPQFETQPNAPTGVAVRVGDPARMLEIYRPTVSLEDGVARATRPVGTPIDLEKMRSIGVIGRRSGDRVAEGKDAHGRRFKATTDELNNTVTQRYDPKHGEAQDVHIRAPAIEVKAQTREVR